MIARLLLPPGSARVPAVVIHHGSAGVTEAREMRYAREIVGMGVAAAVIDSFTPRGIGNTVSDQGQLTTSEMADDAFGTLKLLAQHTRIDPRRIAILGFSKGGSVALEAMIERRAASVLGAGPRFALHIPVYPSCATQFRSRTTGSPVLMLLGGADTYVGVAPCTEYAEKLKSAGASIEVKVYPGAKHGFDGDRAYDSPKGENWSRCVFEEQADGSWKERISGQTTFAAGKPVADGIKAAIAACKRLGVSGGPSPAARAAALSDLKAAINRYLLNDR